MRNRTALTAAVFSCMGAIAYAAWLTYEAARKEQTAWVEVTDPVEEI
ncbi:hypothetical protein [Actinomyces gaoshouyii]|uniref:Uncharacterized protein n=1 Tax=Actinomyces gaoshouyii TaxID=1960083 RepID=A0A8H9LKK7_9ACTO|nr:hypothetical protein [Actinomyces gaoshouyii]GGO95005.1 hypothetical protein GCM10011612_01810 [Actinomyces gaoshouyii]